MHLASRSLATGADFVLLGPKRTMLKSSLPVIAITAVRTGCGKSVIARWLARRLSDDGRRVAVLRHPMPYGDLSLQRVQRFASMADLDAANCTVEEREEYEPHIAMGNVVFAGIDYAAILRAAEAEADIILGMAATMTFRSCGRIFASRWPTLCGRTRSTLIIRARPLRAWPMCW